MKSPPPSLIFLLLFPTPIWSLSRHLTKSFNRRAFTAALVTAFPHSTFVGADDTAVVEVFPAGDAKKLFNEARALESQGNMGAAQRMYAKVTDISPQFVYGWSNLGNTQTAFGDLSGAETSYTTAIDLCNTAASGNNQKCADLYLMLLNRGALRINNGMAPDGLIDLQRASQLRGRPDAILLQNLARAEELNGLYSQADLDYDAAIQMTAGEVAPFWLRSALVKYQIGNVQGGFDIFKRVENRFPEAPEVRAAYSVFLLKKQEPDAARQKFLAIPDRARLKFSDSDYLVKTIGWPPSMREAIGQISKAVGDS